MTYSGLIHRYLSEEGASRLSEYAREAGRELDGFKSGQSVLEVEDSLTADGSGPKVPRGRIQLVFKNLARQYGLTAALEVLADFVAPPLAERITPDFFAFLVRLISRNARALSPEAEARFSLFMWEKTRRWPFFLEYGQTLIKFSRLEELKRSVSEVLPSAAGRSRGAAAPQASEPSAFMAVLNLLAAAGEWEAASNCLDLFKAAFPEAGECGLTRLMRHRTEVSLAHRKDSVDPPPAFMITLDPASPRYRCCSDLVRRTGLEVRPFAGVNGRGLPRELALHLAGGRHFPGRRDEDRGHLGCTISHLALLEHFLGTGRPFALVLEEDAIPYYRFNFDDLAPVLERGHEVVYCNYRRSLVNLPANVAGYRPVPADRTMAVEELLRLDYEAYGGDGYIVSRRGAEKLLEAHRRDGLIDYWDVQMLAYGLKAPQPHRHWWKGRVNDAWRRIKANGNGKRAYLDSVCLELPLVGESGFFNSETSALRNFETFFQQPASASEATG